MVLLTFFFESDKDANHVVCFTFVVCENRKIMYCHWEYVELILLTQQISPRFQSFLTYIAYMV